MKNKIVLFDIDYTLFDTELFREKLYKSILNALQMDEKVLASASKQIIQKVRKEVGYFNPENFSRLLARKLKREKDEGTILNAIFKKQNFRGNYYKETKHVMKKLSKIAKIGIFSKGHDRLQRQKLYALLEILSSDDIHITINKRSIVSEVFSKYKQYKVYVVDDALDVLREIKKINNKIFTIWVKRGFYADKQKNIKNFKPDAVIDDLSKLILLVT